MAKKKKSGATQPFPTTFDELLSKHRPQKRAALSMRPHLS